MTELNGISPILTPIRDRLIEIVSELCALIARKEYNAFSLVEIQVLQAEVGKIDSARIDGKFISLDGTIVAGQGAVIDLIESCYEKIVKT
jgi:hypothetical protein